MDKGTQRDGYGTVRQVADYLGLSLTNIYKLMNDGKLRYAKFGKARRVSWKSVYELAASSTVGEGPR